MFEVTIPARAFVKQRPRFNSRTGRAYMLDVYKQSKANVAMMTRIAYGKPLPLHTGPLRLDVVIRFRKRGAGDLDNLVGGSVMDAFNGILWQDDKQIQRGDWRIERNTGEPDCIMLRIEELP